eukprot:CAMPEP_0202753486 /NCGR_PEP_ID=MMETSP1388-20130828/13618_1 /ASSEMBLY_ACC=CAM_ASM_000864 /TAXON_ID=37098 /ORGANISM="Isochrysis sp, Strain CCMP1244" /LENGTH=69 /DNA_ID=CAMNT_0049421233 /DNA_START=73 /DNA_END=282 /DNA_ORIENTATION=+
MTIWIMGGFVDVSHGDPISSLDQVLLHPPPNLPTKPPLPQSIAPQAAPAPPPPWPPHPPLRTLVATHVE